MDKNALFEFKTDGKRTSLKVSAMTGEDVTDALLKLIDELNKQNAVNLAVLFAGIIVIGNPDKEVMGHAQGKA